MKASITVIGSLNYDMVTYTSVVPKGGETIHAKSFETHYGGKGLNEAVAVGKLLPSKDIHVQMIGCVGDDMFGRQMKEYVAGVGVDTRHVSVYEGQASGTAVILVEDSGENRIMVVAGANENLRLTEPELAGCLVNDCVADYFILQNEQPDPVEHLTLIRKLRPHATVVYNPSPMKEFNRKDPSVLRYVDVLVVNESEALDVAKAFSKQDTKKRDFAEFAKLGVDLRAYLNKSDRSAVIITLGGDGCVAVCAEFPDGRHFPAQKLNKDQIVDTTGAGDTFLGAVTVNLAVGDNIDCAVEFATVAASLTVQGKGAAEAIPTYEQVARLIK